MSRKILPVVITLICLVWMAFISGFYYLYHKPFDVEFAIRMIQFVWQILCALVIISVCGGLGRLIFPDAHDQPALKAFLQMSIGVGITATAVFVIGLAGYLRFTLPLLTILSLILLRKFIFEWWKDLSKNKAYFSESGLYEKTLPWIVAALLAVSLITASAPPIHYDALTYHLALPEAYLLNNRITSLPELVRSGMPQLGEMMYLWSASVGGSAAAAVTGWFTGTLAILALFAAMRQEFSQRSAWIGVAALASGTSIISALGWAYIDWFCLLFGLAGLISLVQWAQNHKTGSLVMAGLFAGFAIASKYTAGVFAVGALLWIVMISIRYQRNILKGATLFLTAAILPVFPWLIKNLISTGNPLYPYFSFSGVFSAKRAAILQNLPPFGNWIDILFLPFRATTVGAEGMAGYSHSIGPLLLILGVFAWLDFRSEKDGGLLLSSGRWISIAGLIVWTAANQFNGILVQTRMYYVLFPAFTILAASGYHTLSSLVIPRLKLDWLISSFVLLVCCFALIQNLTELTQSRAAGYLTGSVSREEYITHNLGWYTPAMEKLRTLPSGDRTLLLYEPRGSLCQPGCIADELLDRWSFSLKLNNNLPLTVLEEWKELGYTHLLVNTAGVNFLKQGSDPHHTLSDLILLEKSLASLPIIENFGDSYILYRLEEPGRD